MPALPHVLQTSAVWNLGCLLCKKNLHFDGNRVICWIRSLVSRLFPFFPALSRSPLFSRYFTLSLCLWLSPFSPPLARASETAIKGLERLLLPSIVTRLRPRDNPNLLAKSRMGGCGDWRLESRDVRGRGHIAVPVRLSSGVSGADTPNTP